jgi:hypothetical protein
MVLVELVNERSVEIRFAGAVNAIDDDSPPRQFAQVRNEGTKYRHAQPGL